MKVQASNVLCVLAAVSWSGSSRGDVVLFSDNFDAGGMGSYSSFNDANAQTQSGTLAPSAYHVLLPAAPNDEPWRLQHSNSGEMLALPGTSACPIHDFALAANAADLPIEVSFNINVVAWLTSDMNQWAQFSVGTSPNLDVLNANVGFSTLFRLNGNTSQLSAGNDITGTGSPGWVSGDLVSILISDTAGTGSAFDGHGSRVTVSIGGNTKSYDVAQLTGGYLSFSGYNYQLVGGGGRFDNLVVSTISTPVPEPSTYGAFVGALALAAAAVRRRDKGFGRVAA